MLCCLGVACGIVAAMLFYSVLVPRLAQPSGWRNPRQWVGKAPRPPPLTVAEYTTLGPAPESGQARSGMGGKSTHLSSWRLVRDRAAPKRSTWSGAAVVGPLGIEGPWDVGKGGCANGLLPRTEADRAQGVDAVQLCGELCSRHADCKFFYINRRTGTDRTVVRC